MSKVKFFEDQHKYISGEKELISVSAFTKKFEAKKDWDKIKQKYAKKNSMTVREVSALWDMKRDKGTAAGTIVHKIKENETLGSGIYKYDNTELGIKQCPHDGTSKLSLNITEIENGHVYPELMIYDLDLGICGQSDEVVIHKNTINILDFKGLALDTEIPTPAGFKLMRDIEVGDSIYDGNGFPTNVKHVSSIHYNPCYRIVFDNKDTIICDHEHKWVISERIGTGKFKQAEKTTDDLYADINNGKILRVECTSLHNEEVNLPIDPYVLGVWLGDGCVGAGRLTNMNNKIWEEIERRGYVLGNDISSNNCGKARLRTVFGLRTKLIELNLLNNKHVPEMYLRASFSQRLDLLRGFMDTDGYYNKRRKRCVMITTRYWQADSLKQIVSSLGWKATIINAKTSGFGKKDIKTYHITFNTDGYSPFLSKSEDYLESTVKNKIMSTFRYIKKVEKIDTVPTKCIAVESSDKTYLATRYYIRTHNTDKSIERRAFSSTYVEPEKLLPPLSHLDNCNFNVYSIKMSLYMYLLWKANKGRFKPGKLILKWCPIERDEDGIPILYGEDGLAGAEVGTPRILREEWIELPYLKKEVIAMLELLKTN